MSLVTDLFFLVLLLNYRWSSPLRLQASHCSTFRIMCDVPSIAVFCSESIECFRGTASRFFLKLLVTIPVATTITGIIVHFRFLIRCISIHYYYYYYYWYLRSQFILFIIGSTNFCTSFSLLIIECSRILFLLIWFGKSNCGNWSGLVINRGRIPLPQKKKTSSFNHADHSFTIWRVNVF